MSGVLIERTVVKSLAIMKILGETSKAISPIMRKYLGKNVAKDFLPIVQHQVKSGGKRVRPALTILCCQACGGKMEDALLPAAMIELIHNYSLIMDDIIDHGELRRGLPTVRAKYGDAQALLAGMFHREVLGEIAWDTSQPGELYAIMVNAIKQTIEGERMDILCEQSVRDDGHLVTHRYTKVTPRLYFKIIQKKTAELIKAACVAGAIAARAEGDYRQAVSTYGDKVGLTFQVIDDFLDIFGEKTGKQKGKDIIEHKLNNIVIVYALAEMNPGERSKLEKIIKKTKLDKAELDQAFALLNSTKAKTKVLNVAGNLVKEAKVSLKILPETPARQALEELADFVASRLY
jgi:geranylgeranyl diphosphate synthase type I